MAFPRARETDECGEREARRVRTSASPPSRDRGHRVLSSSSVVVAVAVFVIVTAVLVSSPSSSVPRSGLAGEWRRRRRWTRTTQVSGEGAGEVHVARMRGREMESEERTAPEQPLSPAVCNARFFRRVNGCHVNRGCRRRRRRRHHAGFLGKRRPRSAGQERARPLTFTDC